MLAARVALLSCDRERVDSSGHRRSLAWPSARAQTQSVRLQTQSARPSAQQLPLWERAGLCPRVWVRPKGSFFPMIRRTDVTRRFPPSWSVEQQEACCVSRPNWGKLPRRRCRPFSSCCTPRPLRHRLRREPPATAHQAVALRSNLFSMVLF